MVQVDGAFDFRAYLYDQPDCDRDVQLTGPLSLALRAELAPRDKQRTYTVTVECRDEDHNQARARATVRVLRER